MKSTKVQILGVPTRVGFGATRAHATSSYGDSSSASFMACVEECISERESRKFEEGLNTKVKLDMYKCFGKSVEFKKYLHGICDAGSGLLFKFKSDIYTRSE